MLTTQVLALILLYIWCKNHDRLWPQQVDMIFGHLRTALAIATSIEDELVVDVDEMTNAQLTKALSVPGAGVKQDHARSKIMVQPGPRECAMERLRCG